MLPNYYDQLNVTPDASAEQIRSAYRRLSLRHHPDGSGQPEDDAFRKICQAYEVLSDPELRADYDRRLQQAKQRQQEHHHPRPANGGYSHHRRSPIEDMTPGYSGGSSKVFGGRVLNVELTLSPDEARRGGRMPLEIPLPVTCPRCQGRGSIGRWLCSQCDGSGKVEMALRVDVTMPARVHHGSVVAASQQGLHLRVHVRIEEG